MKISPNLIGTAFENGYEIVQDRGLAIVGMSLGNSYFNKDRIGELLRCCSVIFSHVRVMIADKPAEHTYKAIGYSPQEAVRKARLKGNTLQNQSQKSIDNILGDVTLVEWGDEIDSHPSYLRELVRVEALYTESDIFREEVRGTTGIALDGKLKKGVEMVSAVNEGVHYLLKELAFLSASPEIFGTERIAYIYHSQWKVYEYFIEGRFDGQKRSDLGFVIII